MLRFLILCLFGLLASGFLFFQYGTEEDRALALRVLRGIKNVVYTEAALHNPEGDVVPDEIDDDVLRHLKER